MTRTCCWVLSQPGVFPATYCGKKTKYIIVKDDDGNNVRKYDNFCAEHKAIAETLDD